MTEDIFENQEDEVEEEVVEEEDDLFEEFEDETPAAPAYEHFVIVRTSSGRPMYIPLENGEAGLSVETAVTRSGLYIQQVEYWLNSARVYPADFVPEGQTLTIIGAVKGA